MKQTIHYRTPELSQKAFEALETTVVLRSPDSPTGYVVSFRYKAPEKDFVGLIGDWLFSDAHTSNCYVSANRMPHEWRPGDFQHKTMGMLKKQGELPKPTGDGPMKLDAKSIGLDPDQFLNGMYEMEKNPETGVFSCTIPLPSGTFLYQFVVDIPENVFESKMTVDPNNMPFERKAGEQRQSIITVPYIPGSGCEDRSIELPYTGLGKGSVEFMHYEGVDGETYATVYLPYDYDAKREKPYPTLYLSHGGNGHHSDWVCQGVVNNLLDHLIAEGSLEPTVVVMMENEIYRWAMAEKCIPNVLNYLIPAVEARYHVDTSPARKAFAGLSMGGMLTYRMLLQHADAFRYFGVFSGGNNHHLPIPEFGDPKPVVMLGYGAYEASPMSMQLSSQKELYDAEIPFSSCVVPGGHQWSVWRKVFEQFGRNILWK